ncbi:MAG: hypothetical protein ACK4ND_14590 [Cytophagaceae bacterium]
MKYKSIANLLIGVSIVFSLVLFIDQLGMSNAKERNDLSHSSVVQVNGKWVYMKDKPWFNDYVIGIIDKKNLPNGGVIQAGKIEGNAYKSHLEDVLEFAYTHYNKEDFNAIVLDEELSVCKVMNFTNKD